MVTGPVSAGVEPTPAAMISPTAKTGLIAVGSVLMVAGVIAVLILSSQENEKPAPNAIASAKTRQSASEWPNNVSGDVPTIEALKRRVKELENDVSAKEKRIRDLEAVVKAASEPGNKGAVVAPIAGARVLSFDDLLDKATIIANDGQFLGVITAKEYGSQSIMNDVGRHGSDVSSTSIFNDVCRYGGTFSSQSPWNDHALDPPKVYLDESFVGYLTKNTLKTSRIDPSALVAYLKKKGR